VAYDAEATTNLVAQFEGFRSNVYRDAVGVETIGYGETDGATINRFRASGISEPEARNLLKSRLGGFASAVEALITVPLSTPQLTALTSFAYNVGVGAFRDSTLRRLLNTGDYGSVRAQLMRWTKGGGRDLPGLVARRKAEADVFESAAAPAPSPTVTAPRTYGFREIHRYARAMLGSKAADPTPEQSWAGKHAVGSWHYRDSAYPGSPDGCADDYGSANSDPAAVFALFEPLAGPGGPIVELIYQHVMWKNGSKVVYSANDHLDHCHVGIDPNAQLPATEEDFLMALSPEQQEQLLAMTAATNDALARLEVAVRDPSGGLVAKTGGMRIFARASTGQWYQTDGIYARAITEPVLDFYRRAGVPPLSHEADGVVQEDVFGCFVVLP